ncbi:hypothetical protein STBA_52210 [Streptomyces sp. MP131-18]|nr:hypothetical protein STBA_52210 [Streptomyces sp. MP131-18]
MTAAVDTATAGAWRPGRRADADGPPPPWLPLFPAVPRYGELCRHLADGGFRHAADTLLPPGGGSAYRPKGLAGDDTAGPGLRVLDGLWLPPERGHDLRRADAAECRRAAERWEASGDPRAGAARHVLDRLAEAADDDPMALRRLVLYQLACLLTDGGPTEDAAVALGVDPAEAAVLAAAVAAGFPAAGRMRKAAEDLDDAWRAHRLHRARQLAQELPPDAADPGLARLRADIEARLADVARELTDAGRHGEAGLHRAAATACLRAVRLAVDDEGARAALLAAAVAGGDSGATSRVAAAVESGTARLTWPAPGRSVRFQVLRWAETEGPGTAVEVAASAAGGAGHEAWDADPPTGRTLRYAVVPWQDGRIAGTARATAPLRVTPDVTGARAEVVPDGLRLRWRAHPAAAEVCVVRTAGPGTDAGTPVPCGPDGLTDRPLPPGPHSYLLRCAYPGEDGETVWSAGERVTGVAEEWPAPVPGDIALAAAADGRVTLGWQAPERGESRLVQWRERMPEPGDDVSAALPGLSALQGEGRERTVTVLPPPRAALRLTAVSVLGPRAVAGPSVLLETLGAVRDLSARRRGPGSAEIAFTWPEPAVLVLVTWEGGGRREERRVPRSLHRAGPVQLPVGRAAYTITAVPLARPDATHATSEPAVTRLPALPFPRLALYYARETVGRTVSQASRLVRR